MVENLPANAEDTGSSPGLGGSHMPRSNWACEPQLLSLGIWSLCSATREAAIVRGPRTAMKSGPRLPQLEKALAQKRRPNTAINKKIKINKLKYHSIFYKLRHSYGSVSAWAQWGWISNNGYVILCSSKCTDGAVPRDQDGQFFICFLVWYPSLTWKLSRLEWEEEPDQMNLEYTWHRGHRLVLNS